MEVQYEDVDVTENEAPVMNMANVSLAEMAVTKNAGDKIEDTSGFIARNGSGEKSKDKNNVKQSTDFSDVKARSNFNETAFFYPQLTTNDSGDVMISFTIPEALTKWKMLTWRSW